jgi:hypothetical protein
MSGLQQRQWQVDTIVHWQSKRQGSVGPSVASLLQVLRVQQRTCKDEKHSDVGDMRKWRQQHWQFRLCRRHHGSAHEWMLKWNSEEDKEEGCKLRS